MLFSHWLFRLSNLCFSKTSSEGFIVSLSNLKTKIDKLDVDKLVPVPVDLSKLSDIVKNDVVRNDVYNAKSKILKIKDLLLLT